MSSEQRPIGSGFDRDTTAAEVLAGIDLDGRLAIVTGGYSGLGLEITRALRAAGAAVVVPARRPDAAADALAAIGGVEHAELDLADLDSVRGFAREFLESGRRIDMLIGNAGVMAAPETRVGRGWELQFATNHLGHFALAGELWPALGDGSRVVSVSSLGHHASPIRWDDIDFERGYDPWLAYGQAKTANVLFAVELDRRFAGAGIRAFSLHPGAIRTPLQRHMTDEEMQRRGWIDAEGNVVSPNFKSPEAGAATATWGATSPQLEGLGGLYLEDVDVARPAADGVRGGVKDWARDPDEARRLWELSAERTGTEPGAR